MPDMTAEQIAALQVAAQERDPQPEPLNAPIPEGVTRVTVFRHSGVPEGMESHAYDFGGEVAAHPTETGALVISAAGSTIGFAPGYWARFEITEADTVEAGEVQ